MIEKFKFTHIGAYHKERNEENQDFVFNEETTRYDVISLADGVSMCMEAKSGAEIAARAITNLYIKKADHFFEFEKEKVADFTLSHILCELKRQATLDGKKDVEEYSSTVASVVVDKTDNKMLCFNLGDCIILATGKGVCRILALPSDSSSGCCVTTTEGALSMTTVKKLDANEIDDIESVVICSDGAWKQMFAQGKMKPEVAKMLVDCDYENLKEFLISKNSFDDYSFISLDMKKRRKSA